MVIHTQYSLWGSGEVVEEKHSELPGGFSLVRILFEDGVERSFINDLNDELCCYFTGIRFIDKFSPWNT